MKKLIYTVLLGFLAQSMVLSQDLGTQKLDDQFLQDFVVPDVPAFSSLGTNPDKILRPGDVKKIALAYAPFVMDANVAIPSSFAMEFSPGKIASKNWVMEDYRNDGFKRFAYNSSISLGSTIRDVVTGQTNVSLGFRYHFASKQGDLLRNMDQLSSLYNEAKNRLIAFADFRDARLLELGINPILDSDKITPEMEAKISNDFAAYISDNADLRQSLEPYIDSFKKANWNATSFDVALAWVGGAPDSLAKNISFKNFHVWFSATIKPSKQNTHSQLLIGLNASFPRNEDKNMLMPLNFAASTRWYEGNRNYRGFLELQYQYNKNKQVGIKEIIDDSSQRLLINLGAEIRVAGNIWIEYTGGVANAFDSDKEKSRFVSSLNLKYGFNQKGK